ncbi:MAG: hypothetical protein P4K94_00415 [Terracidiphilus sp.]|nr:hypothetical protein [Terracidiphilus sp.]
MAALLAISCASFLYAQDALSTNGRSALADGSREAPASAGSASPGAGFHPGPEGFASNGDTPGNASGSSMLWNHLLLDAFQLGYRPGNSSGAGVGGTGFGSAGGGFGNGAGPQQTGGSLGGPPNRAGAGGQGGNPANFGSLFQMASDLSRDLGAGKSGTLGAALGALPRFNRLMQDGLNFSSDLSPGSSRFSYRTPFGAGGSPMRGFGAGSASATYSNPHTRGRKIDFSATAAVNGGGASGVIGGGSSAGMSSFAGTAGGSMGGQAGGAGDRVAGAGGGPGGGSMGSGGPHGAGGGGPSGGQGRPAASLSLHLSF